MAQEIGNNYEQIRLKYGDEVAKSLDKADGKEDKNISKKNLSIFNIALKLLQEEKQQGYQKFENMPQVRTNVSNRMNIDYLAPWAREVATKALNYIEDVARNEKESLSKVFFNDSTRTNNTENE